MSILEVNQIIMECKCGRQIVREENRKRGVCNICEPIVKEKRQVESSKLSVSYPNIDNLSEMNDYLGI